MVEGGTISDLFINLFPLHLVYFAATVLCMKYSQSSTSLLHYSTNSHISQQSLGPHLTLMIELNTGKATCA